MRITPILLSASLLTLFGCPSDDTDGTASSGGMTTAGGSSSTGGGGSVSDSVGSSSEGGSVTASTGAGSTGGGSDTGVATEGATGTGAATGTGGATSTGGGSETGGGTAATTGGSELTCDAYCAQFEELCADVQAADPYGMGPGQDCLSICAEWAEGTVDDTMANTLGCRVHHLGLITNPDTAGIHCPHADQDGSRQCS